MEVFTINNETSGRVPIVVSVPHSGTYIPEELRDEYDADLISIQDDADKFVDKLYEFAPAMGMQMIVATHSRWVIDLNRDPQSKPLYTDGRIITGLCPVVDFQGKHLYRDKRNEVPAGEVQRRLKSYYTPYHNALSEILGNTIREFGKVLLWDCHSIRQYVPAIHAQPFPDLILGDNDSISADSILTETASKSLLDGKYSFRNNFLFKGGYITRHYGNPAASQHALQLEMTKVNYMDDDQTQFDVQRAGKMQEHLKRMFEKLIVALR